MQREQIYKCAVQLIEDTPHQLVYQQRLKPKLANVTIQGGFNAYPCVLVMMAVLVILTLIIAPQLPYPLPIIILGTLAIWYVAVMWRMFRASWKGQVRAHWLIVDKQAKQIIQRYQYNEGHTHEMTYPAAQIHALIPRDFTANHWIMLDYESKQYGRQRLMLKEFSTQAERDAMLTKLQAALNLPIQTQDADKDKGI
jgi:hypothetical protein